MNINNYSDFVNSDPYSKAIEDIYKVSPEVAESIKTFGIGDSLGEEGYDFELGNLLIDLPEKIRTEIQEKEDIYILVSNLAEEYYKFSIS